MQAFDDRLGSPMRIDIALYGEWGFFLPKVSDGFRWEILAYPDDASETPIRYRRFYEYEGFNMLWELPQRMIGATMAYRGKLLFIGNNALWSSIVVAGKSFLRQRIKMASETNKVEKLAYQTCRKMHWNLHAFNFLRRVKANDPNILNCAIADWFCCCDQFAQIGKYWHTKTGRESVLEAKLKTNFHFFSCQMTYEGCSIIMDGQVTKYRWFMKYDFLI